MHLVDCHAVHRGLGFGEFREDGDRTLAHCRWQRSNLKARADVGEMGRRRARLDRRCLDQEAMAAEHVVVVADQPRVPAVRQASCAHCGKGVFGELRMGVE